MTQNHDQYGRPTYTPQPDVTMWQVLQHHSKGLKSERIRAMAAEIATLTNQLHRAEGDRQQLQRFLDSHGGRQVWEQDAILATEREKSEADRKRASEILDAAREEAQKIVADAETKAHKITSEAVPKAEQEIRKADATLSKLTRKIDKLNAEIPRVTEEAILTTAALEEFAHPAESYVTLQSSLRQVRDDLKTMVTEGKAVEVDDVWTLAEMTPTAAKQKQLLRNIGKLALRAYNIEAEHHPRGHRKQPRDQPEQAQPRRRRHRAHDRPGGCVHRVRVPAIQGRGAGIGGQSRGRQKAGTRGRTRTTSGVARTGQG